MATDAMEVLHGRTVAVERGGGLYHSGAPAAHHPHPYHPHPRHLPQPAPFAAGAGAAGTISSTAALPVASRGTSAAVASDTGLTAEHYAMLEQLAHGAYGQVFRASRASDGVVCCVKKVLLNGLSAQEVKDSKNEVAVLRSVSHRNVIRYLDSFVQAGSLHIVTELAVHGDLSQLINRHGTAARWIPEATIWDMFIQTCQGLRHLHLHKILHRDLKPQNIFLAEHGAIKIGDLGFGRMLKGHERFASSGVGTPLYFSPEMCAGNRYDTRVDIWALGCVVHELAALKPPFSAATHAVLADRIMRSPAASIPEHFSIELQYLISQMLQKQAQARPYIDQVLSYPAVLVRAELYNGFDMNLFHFSSLAPPNAAALAASRRVDHITLLGDSPLIGVRSVLLCPNWGFRREQRHQQLDLMSQIAQMQEETTELRTRVAASGTRVRRATTEIGIQHMSLDDGDSDGDGDVGSTGTGAKTESVRHHLFGIVVGPEFARVRLSRAKQP